MSSQDSSLNYHKISALSPYLSCHLQSSSSSSAAAAADVDTFADYDEDDDGDYEDDYALTNGNKITATPFAVAKQFPPTVPTQKCPSPPPFPNSKFWPSLTGALSGRDCPLLLKAHSTLERAPPPLPPPPLP